MYVVFMINYKYWYNQVTNIALCTAKLGTGTTENSLGQSS